MQVGTQNDSRACPSSLFLSVALAFIADFEACAYFQIAIVVSSSQAALWKISSPCDPIEVSLLIGECLARS